MAQREASKKARGIAPTRPENKAIYDAMTSDQQKRYIRLRANKGLEAANQYMQGITGKTPTGRRGAPGQQGLPGVPGTSVEGQFRALNPEQQEREMYEDAGAYYNQMMSGMMNYDPNNPAAGYQQAFGDQLGQARQTVMDQFERSMAPQFEREQAEFQQTMAEQGIDPSSPSYQARYKAMIDAQNNQRLNAQSEAFKLGGQYQQQGFEQAVIGRRLPGELWQATQDPWRLQYTARQEAIQKERDRQAALRQAGISAGAGVRSAQISADAAKYAANLNAINSGYGQGEQRPDWRNSAITGMVAGGTRAVLS
jgi:hypothetical protein